MEIFFSTKLKCPNQRAFQDFTQRMANRIAQGHARYGAPKKEKQYLTRLELEVKAYKKTGNAEHLINIANYCHLEEYAPQHKNFHFDSSVDSVTRGKL